MPLIGLSINNAANGLAASGHPYIAAGICLVFSIMVFGMVIHLVGRERGWW